MTMVMARFRRSMAMHPVNRIKHVVDFNGAVTAGTQLPIDLIKSDDAPVQTATNEVITGSKVYGIYLKVVCASNEATVASAVPNIYLCIQKNPGHSIAAVACNAVGISDLKKYIIHQEMSMIQNQIAGNPTVLFNGVIKIPKGYVRNGPNDRLELQFLCPAINVNLCIQAHFKEFR